MLNSIGHKAPAKLGSDRNEGILRIVSRLSKRAISTVLGGLAFCLALAVPALADISDPEARERLKGITDWDELCAIEDCSEFPVGHATYVFGPEVYYFPSSPKGGVRAARTVERGDDGQFIRSFGNTSGLIISRCCHWLLTYYGLAEVFPDFRADRDGNRMPPARLIISSYDKPYSENKVRRHFDIKSKANEQPSIYDVISEGQVSYNDDFWLLDVWEPNDQGVRVFEALSKRALLNGRHVYALCGSGCNFSTLSFAEDGKNKLPHITLLWLTVTGENMFLCNTKDLKSGCDPSPKVFDQVPRMLGLIEDMFDAAQINPKDQR